MDAAIPTGNAVTMGQIGHKWQVPNAMEGDWSGSDDSSDE